MPLEKILLSKHSKATTNEVIQWVGSDEEKFKLLMHFVLGENQILAQRAAWAMSYVVEEQPQFIYPYLNKLLTLVQTPVHAAIKRNTFRFLKDIEIPKKNLAKALDACFAVVSNKKESIAVISFAFYTLIILSKKFPEIKNELLFAADLQKEHTSKALKNVIIKMRKALVIPIIPSLNIK